MPIASFDQLFSTKINFISQILKYAKSKLHSSSTWPS